MEHIVIEVGENTAKLWESASENTKINASRKINAILNYTLEKEDRDLTDIMDKIGEEAKKNGLTFEVFQDIMDLDVQTMKNLFGEDFHPRQ